MSTDRNRVHGLKPAGSGYRPDYLPEPNQVLVPILIFNQNINLILIPDILGPKPPENWRIGYPFASLGT